MFAFIPRIAVASVVLLLLLITSEAGAFDYPGQTWCQDTISYLVNVAEPSHTCSPAPTAQSFASIIQQAASVWNVDCFVMSNTGTTTAGGCFEDEGDCWFTSDGQNVVSMAPCPLPPYVLAITYSSFTVDGCITEVDVCFADGYSWWVDEGSSSCSGYCYDLLSAAIHEFGHWVSLGHENHYVGGETQVMSPWLYGCEFRRSLTADDVVGLGHACGVRGGPPDARCYPIHYHGLITGLPDEEPRYVDYLGNCHPNPFNPKTTIEYAIERSGHVTLKVYDVAGRLIVTLVDGAQSPKDGLFSVSWNGTDEMNQPVPSGVYFYALQVNGYQQTKKMVLLK